MPTNMLVESDAELLDFLPRDRTMDALTCSHSRSFPLSTGFTAKRGGSPMAKAVTSPKAV